MTSYSNIDDEDQLEKILEGVDNFEERKKIRARLREIRDKQMSSPKEGTEKSGDSTEDDVNKNKDCSETSKAGEGDKENIDSPKEGTEKSGDSTEDVNKNKECPETSKSGEGDKENIDSPKEGADKSGDSTEVDANKNKNCSENSKTGEGDKENIGSPKEGAEKSGDSTEDNVSKNKDCSETSKSGEGDKENIDTKTVVTKDVSGGVKESSETKTVSADGTTTTLTKTTKIVSGNPAMSSTIIDGIGGGGTGSQTTTTEVMTSADGTKTTVIKKTQTVTKTATGLGVGGMAANATKGGIAPPTRPVTRNPSAIKQMLLEWTKAMTQEYADKVVITNFSSSWANGLAFCALIHHFYPDSFDFYALDPKKRRHNFNLAFDTAEKCADIAPLLDTDDMVKMQKPDWKCVFTYVQSFYRKLQKHERNKAIPKE